jgi:hypothetical protein
MAAIPDQDMLNPIFHAETRSNVRIFSGPGPVPGFFLPQNISK